MMKFQFDPVKAKANHQKHGVYFSDAEPVFYDPLALHIEDELSESEERWIAVGLGGAGVILVVVYTFRGNDVRLISARRATKREAKEYEG